MPRIRTIKPEYFNSFDVASVSPMARLFFAFLWTEADREGLMEWKPNNYRMRFFPTDQYDIKELSDELVNQGLIVVHEGEICEIKGFKKHQAINNRESESTLLSRVKHASPRVIAEGREGKEQRVEYAFVGETIKLNRSDYDRMRPLYPNLDFDYQLSQLDVELAGKKNWFHELQSKLNYRNKTPAHQRARAVQSAGLEL